MVGNSINIVTVSQTDSTLFNLIVAFVNGPLREGGYTAVVTVTNQFELNGAGGISTKE